MANHLHRQLREAVATALTGLTTTAARVYPNRLYPLDAASLPALRISLDEERVTPFTVHQPMVLEREIDLVVECCALGGDTVDDTCDQMAKEVEIALAAGFSLGGQVRRPLLTGSRYDDEAGGQDAAVKRLTFSLVLQTLNTAPDAIL